MSHTCTRAPSLCHEVLEARNKTENWKSDPPSYLTFWFSSKISWFFSVMSTCLCTSWKFPQNHGIDRVGKGHFRSSGPAVSLFVPCWPLLSLSTGWGCAKPAPTPFPPVTSWHGFCTSWYHVRAPATWLCCTPRNSLKKSMCNGI